MFPWYIAFRSEIGSRFLASTHYTNYNPWLFAVNLTALILLAIIPKLPKVRYTYFIIVFSFSTDPPSAASPTGPFHGRRIRSSNAHYTHIPQFFHVQLNSDLPTKLKTGFHN